MAEPAMTEEMLTLEQVEQQYAVKRATLYRYVQKGQLRTYRRPTDRRAYVRRIDLERLLRFRISQHDRGPTLAAVARAEAFLRRVFGERVLTTSSAELIEEARRERTKELP